MDSRKRLPSEHLDSHRRALPLRSLQGHGTTLLHRQRRCSRRRLRVRHEPGKQRKASAAGNQRCRAVHVHVRCATVQAKTLCAGEDPECDLLRPGRRRPAISLTSQEAPVGRYRALAMHPVSVAPAGHSRPQIWQERHSSQLLQFADGRAVQCGIQVEKLLQPRFGVRDESSIPVVGA